MWEAAQSSGNVVGRDGSARVSLTKMYAPSIGQVILTASGHLQSPSLDVRLTNNCTAAFALHLFHCTIWSPLEGCLMHVNGNGKASREREASRLRRKRKFNHATCGILDLLLRARMTAFLTSYPLWKRRGCA